MAQLGHKDQKQILSYTLTLPIMLVEFWNKLSYVTQDMKMHTLAKQSGLDAQR